MDIPDIIGLCGAALSIYCYARVQWQRDYAKKMRYSFLNFLSSVLMYFSLSHHFNLASFSINIVWGLISLYGMYRCGKYMWRDYQMAQAAKLRPVRRNMGQD